MIQEILSIEPQVKLARHPIALGMPRIDLNQRESIKQSIAEFGLKEPIVLYEGKILDGWIRYEICLELAILPTFTEELNKLSALNFWIIKNYQRAHYSHSQRAAMAAVAHSLMVEEFKSQRKRSKVDGISECARMFSICQSTVEHAKRVYRSSPELFGKILNGEMKVTAAYKVLLPNSHIAKRDLRFTKIARRIQEDKLAQEVLEGLEGSEANETPNAFSSDVVIWETVAKMSKKGFDLNLVCVEGRFDAQFMSRPNTLKITGYCKDYKHAIVAAMREILKT